jgi:hypothetical protein
MRPDFVLVWCVDRVYVSFSNRMTTLAALLYLKSHCWIHQYRSYLMSVELAGFVDKDRMSACIASAKEHHEARRREIYLF